MNRLYYGDNLDILRRKIKDETVDLCYIDPPFNSKRNYNQIYNNIGDEDRAQAQAFVDTWVWDDRAIAGYDEILSNPEGRFQPRLVELIKEGAALAVLITLEEPSAPMVAEAKNAGQFRHDEMGRSYDRISIVTVRQIVEDGERLEIPMSLEVLKEAQKAEVSEQIQLL